MSARDTPEGDLTPRQREVLERHRAGLTATEIARELGIRSQAVHRIFNRLRKRGFDIPYALPRRQPGPGNLVPPERGPVTADGSFAAVAREIAAQRQALESRVEAIDVEMATLGGERSAIRETIARLSRLAGQVSDLHQ